MMGLWRAAFIVLEVLVRFDELRSLWSDERGIWQW